jgi:hypothetical protein
VSSADVRRLAPAIVHRLVAVCVTAGVLLVGAVAAATSAAADPVLGTANADVTIDETGSADVRIDYLISGATAEGPTAGTLLFSALTFGDATVDDIEVATASGEVLDSSVETAGLKTTVTVPLAAPVQSSQQLNLVVRYSVPQAAEMDGERLTAPVPVLALDLPPALGSPDVFTATVTLPAGYDYVDGFPATPTSVTSVDGSTQLTYEVPAATALLRTVATTGGAPFFTLQRVTEITLLLLIALAAAACYAYFIHQRRLTDGGAPEGNLSPAATPVRHGGKN